MPGDFDPPLQGVGTRGWWAGWTMQTQFYWTQHFPAKGKIELVQTYRPVVGGSYITTNDDGAGSIKAYCGNGDSLKKIKQLKSQYPAQKGSDVALMERTIQYVLKTGNNWNGPIASFHLSVVTDNPDDIVLTCMPRLKRVAPTRYELVRANYRPDHDLDLLILRANR